MSADFDRRTAGSVQASSEGRAMRKPTAMTPRIGCFRRRRFRTAVGLTGVLAGTVLLLGSGAGRAEPATGPVPAQWAAGPVPVQMAAATVPATGLGQPLGYQLPPQLFVLDASSLTQERARNTVVANTRKSLGTTLLYAPTATAELALREAALDALHKNLNIQRSGLAKAVAERALIEAQAVFDPVFVAIGNATLTGQATRKERAEKYSTSEFVPVGGVDSKGVFRCTPWAALLTQTPGVNGCYVHTFVPSPAAGASPVLALQYNHDRTGYQVETVQANTPSPTAPFDQQVYTGTAEVLQQLPWGPSLNLSLSTTRRGTYFPLNTLNGLPETYGNYHRPYFTTIAVGAALPLPYTKNFGPNSIADVSVDVARQNIDAAEFSVRSVINSTLLSVDTLYWQLVGTINSLEVANQSLQAAEQQRGRIQKLFEQGFVTESDRAQADAQISNIRTTQQQLFASYISTSEAMRQLLDRKDDALLLPIGDLTLLKRPATDILEADRVLNNPSYQRQAVAVRIASLRRGEAETQTRPNLALTANVSAAECCSYGYSSLGASLYKSFMTQDQFTATVGLLYQLPIGNRAAEAALTQAEHNLNQQAIALHEVELTTRESFETARGSLASAREQVRIAKLNVQNAQKVYDLALEQQDQGLVAAYEALSRLSTVLSARTALVQAEVQQRIAESALLASVGALAERYGDLTAQTGLDRERLALLRDSGALKHFGGPL